MPEQELRSLTIRLFGPFEVLVNGDPLARLRTRKGQWLLALLTLRAGCDLDRAWLAGTLWPDSPEPRAFNNLRVALADLRRALGPEANRLRSPAARSLRLDLTGMEADVVAFDRAINSGAMPSLERAVTLYRGPLLEGCAEEWVFAERQSREQAYLRALETLAEQALASGNLMAAEGYLRRAIAVDPLRESAQRALMQALAAGSNYASALLAYRELRLRLHRELNAAPDPETQAVFQQVRAEARSRAQVAPAVGYRSLVVPDLPTPLPPLRSLEAFRHNLPLQLTRFIGRERQMAEVKQLLGTSRLVTLTGAGGCGKTRLALQVAARMLEHFPEGVWLVELAPLADPALAPQTVATALGVQEAPSQPLLQTLVEQLRPRQLLLVLDNCEHVVGACAQLAEGLLQRCPRLRVLATSREALGIAGETRYRVPSLSVPEGQRPAALEELGQYEAVRLFLERAGAVQPGFRLTPANAPGVAEVCRRLDGIPLAIELAAARVNALPVEEIAARLEDRFRLLTGGSRTALPRHQTLRSLIDWSYDLLSEAERRLLRRLSVFAGGWTLEAAEAVCSGESTEKWEVLDLLTALVEKSLVVYEGQGTESRYRLLETIRQYAQELLEATAEAAAIGRQHSHYFLALAEEAEPRLWTSDRRVWLDQIQQEHDNMRAALAWSHREPEAREIELRLAGALCRFWFFRGNYMSEGRQWLEGALAGIEAEAREEEAGFTRARAKVLSGFGILAAWFGDPASAQLALEEAVALWHALGDKYWLAVSLRVLGHHTAAVSLLEESVALSRELGDRFNLLMALYLLGNVVLRLGDPEAARSCYSESLAIARELGDKWALARPLAGLGTWALLQGDDESARSFYEESVFLRRQDPDPFLPWFLRDLGHIALRQRDFERARAAFEEALIHAPERLGHDARAWLLSDIAAVARCQGDEETARSFCEQSQAAFQELLGQERGWAARSGEREAGPRATGPETEEMTDLARCLEGLAAVAVTRGQMTRAARLFGAAASLAAWLHDTSSMRSPFSPGNLAQFEGNIAAARGALGEEAFTAAWAAGRALTLEEAVAEALEAVDHEE